MAQCHEDEYTINITNCYSTGKINQYANGICGDLNTGSTITITRCYASGEVYLGSNSIASISGSGTLTISNCYGNVFNNTTIFSLNKINKDRDTLRKSVWDKGTKKIYPYPKLKAFKYPPWRSSKYKNYLSPAQFNSSIKFLV